MTWDPRPYRPAPRPPKIVVTIAALLVGLCAAAALVGYPRVAFFLAVLSAAATLSVLRDLVHREH